MVIINNCHTAIFFLIHRARRRQVSATTIRVISPWAGHSVEYPFWTSNRPRPPCPWIYIVTPPFFLKNRLSPLKRIRGTHQPVVFHCFHLSGKPVVDLYRTIIHDGPLIMANQKPAKESVTVKHNSFTNITLSKIIDLEQFGRHLGCSRIL